MNSSQRAPWQLPRGVSRGLWEYALAPHIARDYDDCFSYNKLFQLDQQVLQRYFDPGPQPGSKVVVDLGCGTGRALCPLVTRGFRGIAVDLSPHMLRVVREKSRHDQLPIDCVRANLVDLDCLADASADYAISLFSTLGMIRGSENRFQSVRHTARILKPGGLFVLHVHNYWYNLYDPMGPWWVVTNLFQAWRHRELEAGDKFFDYCGIPQMYLHLFRQSEVLRMLRRAGFRVLESAPLDARRNRLLRYPRLFPQLRANGWIFVAERGM